MKRTNISNGKEELQKYDHSATTLSDYDKNFVKTYTEHGTINSD